MIVQRDSQFIQHCPVCGQPMRMGTRCAGHRVTCHHCCGQFIAGHNRGSEDDIVRIRRIEERTESEMPSMLVVESRDVLYQHLSVDLTRAGFRVMRATCASAGITRYFSLRPDFVLSAVDLPDQSGWLLTAKLCVTEHQSKIWLYQSKTSRADAIKASLIGAQELLAYESPQELSSAVLSSLAVDTWPPTAVADSATRSLTMAVGQ